MAAIPVPLMFGDFFNCLNYKLKIKHCLLKKHTSINFNSIKNLYVPFPAKISLLVFYKFPCKLNRTRDICLSFAPNNYYEYLLVSFDKANKLKTCLRQV